MESQRALKTPECYPLGPPHPSQKSCKGRGIRQRDGHITVMESGVSDGGNQLLSQGSKQFHPTHKYL